MATRPQHSRGRARVGAAVCLAGFVAAVEALSATRAGYSDREDQISDLLVGSTAGLARGAFGLLALGGGLVAWRQLRSGARVSGVLGLGYAVSVVVTGLTVPGQLTHRLGATAAFTLAPLVVVTAPQLPRTRRAVFAALVALSFATWPAGPGLGERITAYLEIAGLLWLTATPDHVPRTNDVSRGQRRSSMLGRRWG